ncbi:MAG: hypothetical protein R3E68_16390 [Burkholderiaceae bacterium]
MELMRHEDLRLITGNGRFYADWHFPGSCTPVIVRSDHAHARIEALDLTAAKAMPGVVAVFTAVMSRRLTTNRSRRGRTSRVGGKMIAKAPLPVLARDIVRFVGQPIAMVVANRSPPR